MTLYRERSVIIMILHWHSFQVFSLSKCVDDTPTKTGLNDFVVVACLEPLIFSKERDIYLCHSLWTSD